MTQPSPNKTNFASKLNRLYTVYSFLAIFLFLALLLLPACNPPAPNTPTHNPTHIHDTTRIHDTITIHDTIYQNNYQNKSWQNTWGLTQNPDVDSIWFKPVSYYINDKNCSALAIDFYRGHLKPTDDGVTEELLKLATTDNAKLRPFYRWCLNKTLQQVDGALAELVGMPARRYAEKFPNEFFTYMDIDTTGEKEEMWTNAIAYSGFYDEDDVNNLALAQQNMAQKMNANCTACSAKTRKRIETFTKNCFKDTNAR